MSERTCGSRDLKAAASKPSNQSIRVVLHGATGRMGAALFSLCKREGVKIVGAIAQPGCGQIGQDLGVVHDASAYGVIVTSDVGAGLCGADVVIDFSHVAAVPQLAREAARCSVALVSGTTGLDEQAKVALDEASQRVPVLWASNFSVGLQVLAEVVAHAVRRLGAGFDVEVVETHHRFKKDAPSGTAMRLAQEIEAARGEMVRCFGREGLIGQRGEAELGVHALRGGDVVGDHTVHLLGMGERLELTHRATSREVFARGALFSARAVVGRRAGRWHLKDLLA